MTKKEYYEKVLIEEKRQEDLKEMEKEKTMYELYKEVYDKEQLRKNK